MWLNSTESTFYNVTHVQRHYRPHPKDGEGTVFTGVCLSTPGGYPSPRFFPRSMVIGPFWGRGTPVPGSFPGHWSQVPSRGYPNPGQGVPQSWLGGTPGWTRQNWGSPCEGQGWGSPTARSGWGTPWPGQDGVLPWPGQDWGTPPRREQPSEHLLRGGRFASCIYAGGLSCYNYVWSKIVAISHIRYGCKLWNNTLPGPKRDTRV